MGRVTTFGLLLLAGVASCAGAEAMSGVPAAPKSGSDVIGEPLEPGDIGMSPGETMAFEVRIGGVLAGEAQLAVGEPGEFEGKQAIVVRSKASTAGAAALLKRISDEATTVIELETGRPLQVDTVVEMGSRRTEGHAKFLPTMADVTYKRSDQPNPVNFKVNFGQQLVYETHSAMAQVRGWRAPAGTMREVWVVGGRRLWRVDVKILGTETIGSAVGNRRAIKFEGASYRARPNFTVEATKAARTFTVWLSDDADRVPLKVVAKTELGDVTVDLVDYSHP